MVSDSEFRRTLRAFHLEKLREEESRYQALRRKTLAHYNVDIEKYED